MYKEQEEREKWRSRGGKREGGEGRACRESTFVFFSFLFFIFLSLKFQREGSLHSQERDCSPEAASVHWATSKGTRWHGFESQLGPLVAQSLGTSCLLGDRPPVSSRGAGRGWPAASVLSATQARSSNTSLPSQGQSLVTPIVQFSICPRRKHPGLVTYSVALGHQLGPAWVQAPPPPLTPCDMDTPTCEIRDQGFRPEAALRVNADEAGKAQPSQHCGRGCTYLSRASQASYLMGHLRSLS